MTEPQKPPQSSAQSPYAAPAYSQVPQKSPPGGGGSLQSIMPLYEARGWITLLGWLYIIGGILYALTCIGIVVAWLPIWMGVCLKKSAENLQMGVQHQNGENLRIGTESLATFFKIIGVCSILGLVLSLGYVVLVFFMIFAGGLTTM